MTATHGTVAKWGGRLILATGVTATLVGFILTSRHVEIWTTRPTTARVVATGEEVRENRRLRRTYTVPTVTLAYTTAAGTQREIVRDRPNALTAKVGDEVPIWYSPLCMRDGQLRAEGTATIDTAIIEGFLVAVALFATFFVWRLWLALAALPGAVAGTVSDTLWFLRLRRDLRQATTHPPAA